MAIALARFIDDVRVLEPAPGGAIDVDHLPDGKTSFVFRLLDGERGDVSVAGPRTRALFKSARHFVRAVRVQFKPGWAAPLFGVSASSLTDRIVTMDDLWGREGRDLYFDLRAARNVPEMLDRLARAMALRVPSFEPASARLARRAVRLLEGGEDRVACVAEQLGVTARHLRRAFTENVGIGPKEFARTVRLQRALRGASRSQDWAAIATDAGYYDQAHLIADFRRLVGLTPGAFAKRANERRAVRELDSVK